MDWISAVAFASTGSAGTGAAKQVGEFVLGWLFIIVGIAITAAVVVKGVSLLGDDHRGSIIPFLITLLFSVVLIGSSRQIASEVTGFAGGTSLETASAVLPIEIVGYLLGDVLWWTIAIGGWMLLYAMVCWTRRQVPHGD